MPLPLTPAPLVPAGHLQRALGHRQRHRLEPEPASTSLIDRPVPLQVKRDLLGGCSSSA